MNDEWKRWWACGRKIRFRSEHKATKAMRMKPMHQKKWRAYECRYCGGWHLASNKPVN